MYLLYKLSYLHIAKQHAASKLVQLGLLGIPRAGSCIIFAVHGFKMYNYLCGECTFVLMFSCRFTLGMCLLLSFTRYASMFLSLKWTAQIQEATCRVGSRCLWLVDISRWLRQLAIQVTEESIMKHMFASRRTRSHSTNLLEIGPSIRWSRQFGI